MASRFHALKTWPEPFAAVADGRKPFEIRWDDRDFQVGDQLVLDEYRPDHPQPYTGRSLVREVAYVLPGGQFDLPIGVVVMGLAPTGHYRAGIIEACAQACEMTEREGWEWVKDSLWANILKLGAAGIRALQADKPLAPTTLDELASSLGYVALANRDLAKVYNENQSLIAARTADQVRIRELVAELGEAREISRTFEEHWPYGSDHKRDDDLRRALCAVQSPTQRHAQPATQEGA